MSNSETTKNFSLIHLPDIPEAVENAAKNITDYPSKNIGQTFGDIWYLVFGAISQAADKKRMKYANDLEQYKLELDTAINRIPEKDRTTPSIQVTGQALENSKYCISSENLREMFVNLISGAMNKNMEAFVHPSFPEIIKQMSDKDAIFLKFMKYHFKFAIANIGINISSGGYTDIYADVCGIKPEEMSDEECSAAISSLKRAGLIETTYMIQFKDDSKYNSLKNHPYYKGVEQTLTNPQNTIRFQKGQCYLTKLGINFVKVCIE